MHVNVIDVLNLLGVITSGLRARWSAPRPVQGSVIIDARVGMKGNCLCSKYFCQCFTYMGLKQSFVLRKDLKPFSCYPR